MNLTFDNLSELDDFLRWANRYGTRRDTFTAGDGSGPDLEARDLHIGPYAGDGPLPVIDTSDVAFDTPPGVTETKTYTDGTTATGPGPLPDQSPAQQGAEPAKRKRRTKAEIEAAAAAEAKRLADLKVANAAADACRAENFEEAGEAMKQAAGGETPPAGTNPFEQAATASTEPAGEAATGTEDADEAVVTPFQHLTRAREFIAKHGMPKYNESFTKAGLDANVMGYSAYQRGLHMDALDALEKA